MSPRPYRELALVPSVVEPTELWPWHSCIYTQCPKCQRAVRDNDGKIDATTSDPVLTESVLCTGRRGLLAWLRRTTCRETREHFHVRCRVCRWTTLMATADVEGPAK
jgi:hypothetical protein